MPAELDPDEIATVEPTPRRGALIGAFAGAVATLGMSAVMLPARWLGLLGTQPPRRITDRALSLAGAGRSAPEPVRRAGTAIVHLGSGAVFGAAYGLGRVATRGVGPGAAVGTAYGAGVWGLNYIVAAPALDLFAPPWKDRPARPAVMFAAHVVYGVLTATVVDRLLSRARST